ncbi:MAG: M48 family metallopeptidase [Betaproteobacteria bacterium]|nr:M48 family metallopeptidase [Betaproteobacteria bacterium]
MSLDKKPDRPAPIQLDLFAPFEFFHRPTGTQTPPASPPPRPPVTQFKRDRPAPPAPPLADSGRLRLGDQDIDYLVRRNARRRVGLQVDDRGLVVLAPSRVTDRHIHKVLREGAEWVLRKLSQWRARAPVTRDWRSGAHVDFLGEQLVLSIDATEQRPQVLLLDDHRLSIQVANPDDAAAVRGALVHWFRRHALGHFPGRVEHYARALNLRKLPRTFVSNATTRWGSCNSKREIRLNWRLLQAPNPLIDYVVAHEVAHIIEMNHSARFWNLVESLCPGHDSARVQLDAMTRHYMSL